MISDQNCWGVGNVLVTIRSHEESLLHNYFLLQENLTITMNVLSMG